MQKLYIADGGETQRCNLDVRIIDTLFSKICDEVIQPDLSFWVLFLANVGSSVCSAYAL